MRRRNQSDGQRQVRSQRCVGHPVWSTSSRKLNELTGRPPASNEPHCLDGIDFRQSQRLGVDDPSSQPLIFDLGNRDVLHPLNSMELCQSTFILALSHNLWPRCRRPATITRSPPHHHTLLHFMF